jgi:hypothetical protein
MAWNGESGSAEKGSFRLLRRTSFSSHAQQAQRSRPLCIFFFFKAFRPLGFGGVDEVVVLSAAAAAEKRDL